MVVCTAFARGVSPGWADGSTPFLPRRSPQLLSPPLPPLRAGRQRGSDLSCKIPNGCGMVRAGGAVTLALGM